jgi:hypothetical protein
MARPTHNLVLAAARSSPPAPDARSSPIQRNLRISFATPAMIVD